MRSTVSAIVRVAITETRMRRHRKPGFGAVIKLVIQTIRLSKRNSSQVKRESPLCHQVTYSIYFLTITLTAIVKNTQRVKSILSEEPKKFPKLEISKFLCRA